MEQFVGDGDFAVVVERFGEVSSPAGEVVGFERRGFEGFDALDSSDADAFEFAVVFVALHVAIFEPALDFVEGDDVEQGEAEGDRGEEPVVGEHDQEVEQGHDDVDGGFGHAAGDGLGDFFVEFDPSGDFTGEALGVVAKG